MAGVGFELQKLVRHGTYFSYLRAFLYGMVLSSGPWLTTTAALILIGLFASLSLHAGAARLLTMTIIYAYAFSLIVVGPWQNLLTRYVADKVFERKLEEILPGLRTASLIVAGLGILVAVPAMSIGRFLVPVDRPLVFRLGAVALFLLLGQLWVLMSYVSTSKTYRHVVASFGGGCTLSVLLALVAVRAGNVSWALVGYATGQGLIVLSLYILGKREYGGKGWWRRDYLANLRPYRYVALSGLLYNAGVWIDKIVIWFTLGELQGMSIFRSYNPYDVPAFLAFLSMVPALAWFLIIGETAFYEPYKKFVRSLLNEPLVRIEGARRELYEATRQTVGGMAKFQGVFTLILFIVAVPFLRWIGYGWVSPSLFRILLLGAFANVLFLNVVILMLYLELRQEAASATLVFFVANLGLTLLTAGLGESYLGWSYLISAAGALGYSWFVFDARFERIDYYLYTRQVPT